MDNRFLNGLLLVDLKKAFDLSKLQLYGCSSSTVQWFTSYLSDRVFNVLALSVQYLSLCLKLKLGPQDSQSMTYGLSCLLIWRHGILQKPII